MNKNFNLFSFSTCWNVGRHTSGKDMIMEIKELGFNNVELNYNVTMDMFKGIVPLVEKGKVSISSIHNVFPKILDDDYSTDSLMLAFTDKQKRKQAIEYTFNTVEYAARMGARAVVVHTSEIPVPINYDSILKNMYENGQRQTAEYEKIKNEFIEYREKTAEHYLQLTKESLEEICNKIQKKGYNVVIGIENRARCYQIPNFVQADIMLEHLKDLPVYFWHDIGHGIIMDELGLVQDFNEILKLKDRIYGVHIHDTIGIKDHVCPYIYKDADYDKYIDIIKDAKLKVFELGGNETKSNIKKSMNILYEKLLYTSKNFN